MRTSMFQIAMLIHEFALVLTENVYVYRTFKDSEHNQQFTQFVTSARREHMIVEVQACSDAWLVLTSGVVRIISMFP